MSAQDDIQTAVNDLQTLEGVLTQVANDLGAAPVSPSDATLEAIVKVLTDNGYTVTAPNPEEQA